ncbi:MAG: hypothetical protein FJ311_16245 [Rhodospirillales bacterium]|nr:hypothetical protein [Rhodospirillales bacterium]
MRTEQTSQDRPVLRIAVGLAVLIALAGSPPAAAKESGPDWRPQSSERLVKLPATYLKKSLDRDFAESALGTALQGADEEIGLKGKTLADLKNAINQAEDEVRTELRHQFLAEKKAYLDLMSRKNALQRKHAAIKVRLFDDMLQNLNQDKAGETPAKRDLIKRQDAARTRFESSLASVDMAMFRTGTAPESKYAVKYAENVAAIEQLVARIQNHKMNAGPTVDGEQITKQDYLRQMLAEAQSELAIRDQEDVILGHMAKLVALDAMTLAEETLDSDLAAGEAPNRTAPSQAVQYFMSN